MLTEMLLVENRSSAERIREDGLGSHDVDPQRTCAGRFRAILDHGACLRVASIHRMAPPPSDHDPGGFQNSGMSCGKCTPWH